MLIGGVFSFIGDSAKEMIVGIFLLIDSLIYTFVGWLYQLFLVLASFRLFESDMYESIKSSIYTIIGVVLLFILAFELLKMMVDPDKAKGAEVVKKIIINLISSMAMFAIVPVIFTFMFDFQDSILSNNVLGKLLLPTFNSTDFNSVLESYGIENDGSISEEDFNYYTLTYYGNSMSTQLFQAFFYPTGANTQTFSTASDEIYTKQSGSEWLTSLVAYGTCGLAVAGAAGVSFATALIGTPSFGAAAAYCATAIGINYAGQYITDMLSSKYNLTAAYNTASIYGEFSVFQKFSSNVIENEITYHYLISSIVGLVVVYILAIYCIDLGVRVVKLAFYEIIAPIPIFLKIIPKQEKIFSNWLKAVLSTYFEVFMRMFILYLGVFFISYIPSIIGNVFGSNSAYSENLIIYLLVRVVLIIGVLIFVKQMPKLIEEVTGIKSGNFSLNIMDHLKDAAWAPAAVGGLIAGHGNPMAMLRAGANGWKNNNLRGIGAEARRREELQEARRQGSTFGGRMVARGRGWLGLETLPQENDRRLNQGYDLNGDVITAENDTSSDIKIKDENGNIISTFYSGATGIAMDSDMQDNIATTKNVNAREISSINLQGQRVSDAISSNKGVISVVDDIESKARKKYANSDIKVAIDLGDGVKEYNQAELSSYISTLQNSVGNYSEKLNTVSYLENELNNIHTNGEVQLDLGDGMQSFKYSDISSKILELNNSESPDMAKISMLQNALNNFDSMATLGVDYGNGLQRLNSHEIQGIVSKLNQSATADKLKESQVAYLGQVLADFEAKGWEKYADAVLRGEYEQVQYDLSDMSNVQTSTQNKTSSVTNADIEGLRDVLLQKLQNGELYENVDHNYTQEEINTLIQGLNGIDLLDTIKSTAKENNREHLAVENERLSNEKDIIKAQNDALDRLLSQLKEQQDIAKQSRGYRARKSDSDFVNKGNGGGK